MGNVFTADLKKVGHVALGIIDGEYVVEGVKYIGKAEAVIATVIKEQSDFKAALITVVKDATVIGAELAAVVAERGVNWSDDTVLLAKVQNFLLADINTLLIPEVEKVFTEIKTDIEAAPATTTAPAA